MHAADRPAISILVCTRNRPEDLRRCLDSILANSFADYELLVVDQSDDGATAEYLGGLADPRLRWIPTESRGLARARNIALCRSRAELVAFTDDDCICDAGWIESMVWEFDTDPRLDGLFGRVLPWGDRQTEGLFCHCLITDETERTVSGPVPPHNHLGHGNNMVFRKDVFRKVGLYNPAMGAGTRLKSGEDTDLTYRALRANRVMKYSPRPLVHHNNWKTYRQADRLDLGYVLGFVMVLGKFALAGDRVARRCLRERLGELRDDMVASIQGGEWGRFCRIWMKVGYYLAGFVPALYFRLKGDLPWPAEWDRESPAALPQNPAAHGGTSAK
jgi:glycosyltransferase involved in cell wall biosynthesis